MGGDACRKISPTTSQWLEEAPSAESRMELAQKDEAVHVNGLLH